jgi:cob(I)alamin adenosyltransferase
MVVLNRIYTRTGDAGDTALGSGERVPKHDVRVAAYGTVDETNATLGVVILNLSNTPRHAELRPLLQRIQNDLFDLGADLCVPEREGVKAEHERLTVTDGQVAWLESQIDTLNARIAPLRSFVLPGGSPAAAHLHVARTVCRRAERLVTELAGRPGEAVAGPVLRYLNRLSDFLFVASRAANGDGADDVLWVPGKNR